MNLKIKVATLFSAILLCGFEHNAQAQIDFVPTQISDVSITGTMNHRRVSFNILVENNGQNDFTGRIRIKPLLIPVDGRAGGYVNDKGVVLFSEDIDTSIPAQSSAVVQYESTLPRIARRNYAITAIVNSNRVIAEPNALAFENNLVPNLLDIGTVESGGTNPDNVSADYYSDSYEISFLRGGANHTWRFFKRGELDYHGVRALFLMADISKRKVYGSSYEKTVAVWLNMGQAYDSQGRLVPFDRYHQAPVYEHVPAGNLTMLSLMNHTDGITETVIANNLDMRHFSASHLAVSSNEIWCTSLAGDATAVTQPLVLSTQYNGASTWTLTSTTPDWLQVNGASGVLSGNVTQQLVNVTCNPTGLAAGTYEANLAIAVTEFPAESKTVKVKYFVLGGNEAEVTVPASVDFTAVQGRPAASQTLLLSNRGNAEIDYRLSTNQDWILLQNTSGSIPPGGSVAITVLAENQTLFAAANGTIEVTTNRPGAAKSIPVTYTGSVPTEF